MTNQLANRYVILQEQIFKKKNDENHKKVMKIDRKSLCCKSKLFFHFFIIDSKNIFYSYKIFVYTPLELLLKLF